MTRRAIQFPCEGSLLAGTIDEAPGETGLLIVSGGNEIRAGAWAGQAQLAARIAAAGYPVLRFDRRGVGDSEGGNAGFRSSGPDIAAALAALRAEAPQVRRVVAFGNCDAASALMLVGGASCDALVLANPWTFDGEAEAPPPQLIRDHYRRRLSDPRALLRLLMGRVSLRQALASLRQAAGGEKQDAAGLAQEMAQGLDAFPGEVHFLLAERDRTAKAFLARWNRQDPRLLYCPAATHGFVEAAARDWLTHQLLEVLAAADRAI